MFRRFAKGRRRPRVPGAMNRLEREYGDHLAVLHASGDVEWFAFEAVKLKLADKTFYTPDFIVMAKDGVLELHEVKGHWEDDARVKVKVVASLFPFRVRCIKARGKRDGGGWVEEVLTHDLP